MARPVVLNLKATSLHVIGGYAATLGCEDVRICAHVPVPVPLPGLSRVIDIVRRQDGSVTHHSRSGCRVNSNLRRIVCAQYLAVCGGCVLNYHVFVSVGSCVSTCFPLIRNCKRSLHRSRRLSYPDC